ncbi:helix-turn-helix domain-containing protein [Nocardia gamkensis]|uniref:helix-turn-helix domain-containing protein n=1 Tax=Nocardia gamkensis TaxID=352869 RepID=UPI0036E3A534
MSPPHPDPDKGSSPEDELLVRELTRLQQRANLSLRDLEAATQIGKNQWSAFLNGSRLPTREAVERLAETTGTPPVSTSVEW